MTEHEQLEHAIAALEAQRAILGDSVVDAALAPMREKLMALQAQAITERRKQVTVLFSDSGEKPLPLLAQTGENLVDRGPAFCGQIGDQGREGLRKTIRHLGEGSRVLEQLPDLGLDRQLRGGHLDLKSPDSTFYLR